jgi:glyoxylase-like metal-dependent hydrolase (beta-lactamase superfamily II)
VLIPGFPGANVRGYLAWSSVVLVRAAERVILFDTGSAGDRPGVVAGVHGAGLDLSDIDLVVLSHLHFDHVANAELFDAAEIAVHQAELDAASRHDPHTDLARSRWHTEALLKSRIWPVQDERTQVADGVELWHTPGHTPGSLSLVLHTEEDIVILAGDTIKDRRQLLLPPSVGDDLAALRVSTELIADRADVIVPGHDVPLRRAGDHFKATEASRTPLRYTVGWA